MKPLKERIAFIPYRLHHLAELGGPAGVAPEILAGTEVPGFSFTMTLDGAPVAAGGLYHLWRNHRGGAAIAWTRISERMPRRAWWLAAQACAMKIDQAHAFGYSRIDADTPARSRQGRLLLDRLGFTCFDVCFATPDGVPIARYKRERAAAALDTLRRRRGGIVVPDGAHCELHEIPPRPAAIVAGVSTLDGGRCDPAMTGVAPAGEVL